jgi:benzoate/toluate 1,2-dioxygenase beta subunit
MRDLTHAVEQFLIEEAALLDDRRFEDWLALYDDDAYYWAPVLADAAVRGLALAHYDEDRIQMQARVKRLQQPTAYSEQPPMRAVRLVGNVRILETLPDDAVRVGSRLIVHTFRNSAVIADMRAVHAAAVQHLLRPRGAGFRIGWKRIDLVDAQGSHFVASVPL